MTNRTKKGQFKPGASGNPKGREKGSKNKKTFYVQKILEKKGFDPFEALAEIARDENNDLSIRVRCLTELCQYCLPKLKATELSADDLSNLRIKVKLD